MTLIDIAKVQRGNPLEVVEHMATTHLWSFERACEDELTIVVQGKWADYQVLFTWMYDIEALHLACSFEFQGPERNNAEIEHLSPMRKSHIWVGHIEYWSKVRVVRYRHATGLS